VMFFVVHSNKFCRVKPSVAPAVIDALVGVIAIETRVGAVTVSGAEFEVTPPNVAVILLVPADTPWLLRGCYRRY